MYTMGNEPFFTRLDYVQDGQEQNTILPLEVPRVTTTRLMHSILETLLFHKEPCLLACVHMEGRTWLFSLNNFQ